MTAEFELLASYADAGLLVVTTPCTTADGKPTLGGLVVQVYDHFLPSAHNANPAARAAFLLSVTQAFRARADEFGLTPA